jgi:hypothetical protein
MPKPTTLTLDALISDEATPLAATLPRAPKREKVKLPKTAVMPLQVRWPREDVRAVKIAAAEREQTVSDFMLACFHASMTKK